MNLCQLFILKISLVSLLFLSLNFILLFYLFVYRFAPLLLFFFLFFIHYNQTTVSPSFTPPSPSPHSALAQIHFSVSPFKKKKKTRTDFLGMSTEQLNMAQEVTIRLGINPHILSLL